jgi:O-antigen ligase
VIAALFGATYVARASLAAYIGTEWTTQFVEQCSIAAVLCGCAYVLAGGVARLNWRGLAVILAAGVSLCRCESFDYSLTRWLGWTLMLVTVGPVNNSRLAQQFRRSTLTTITAVFTLVTIASAAWWVVGLPNLGRGDFTGVMWHSMTLGPLAAVTGLVALARATRGSAAWYGVFACACLVAVLAASRSAIAAMVLGVMVIVILRMKRRPILSMTMLAVALVGAVAPETTLDVLGGLLPERITGGLSRKQWDHTRELHWQARWDEFCASPLTGVGFAVGWEGSIGYNDETGAIETGSSYLSILSMTGILGATAFLWLTFSLARRTWRRWPSLAPREKLQTASLGAFWSVHLGAEGYIYAVSSLMGLAFWLWLGCLGDQLDARATLPASPASTRRRP